MKVICINDKVMGLIADGYTSESDASAMAEKSTLFADELLKQLEL